MLAIKSWILATGSIALAAYTIFGGGLGISAAGENAVKLPAPTFDSPAVPQASRETAVFAGGCFWGVQGVFQHTNGVLNAVSGYSGGEKSTANYDTVSAGRSGHAEAVQITYDPKLITYGKLLQIYFSVAHDPTTLNSQGPDHGTQYRSAVFYQNANQKLVTERCIVQLDATKVFTKKIVTQLAPLAAFYPAEAYHQDYLALNPSQPYIATFDLPKIRNLQVMMPEVYRDQPVLMSQAGQ